MPQPKGQFTLKKFLMKEILCFAGSNSSRSINHQWVSFVATQISRHKIHVIKLVDFPLEMFSEDVERENGYSDALRNLHSQIKASDALIISVNEHNSNPSAFFKNVVDWLSRLDKNFLEDKKILLTSTSNGRRGGLSSLEVTQNLLPRFKGEVVVSFNFPSFQENFSVEKQKITNPELEETILGHISRFQQLIEE